MAVFVELKDEDAEPPQHPPRRGPIAIDRTIQGEPSQAHALAKTEHIGGAEVLSSVPPARNVVAEAFSCYP